MSRKRLLWMSVVLPVLLGASLAWAKSNPRQTVPHSWVVHIKRMTASGQTGLWPDSTSVDGKGHEGMPWLHRSNKDKIQFVIDSGADSCELVFDSVSPLVPLGQPNNPATKITVHPSGSPNNGYYVVSSKLAIPQGKYCQYWFNIVGNPDCPKRTSNCLPVPPPASGEMFPCWYKGAKPQQVGPGMDVSD
jgi:hypothetical protein